MNTQSCDCESLIYKLKNVFWSFFWCTASKMPRLYDPFYNVLYYPMDLARADDMHGFSYRSLQREYTLCFIGLDLFKLLKVHTGMPKMSHSFRDVLSTLGSQNELCQPWNQRSGYPLMPISSSKSHVWLKSAGEVLSQLSWSAWWNLKQSCNDRLLSSRSTLRQSSNIGRWSHHSSSIVAGGLLVIS